MHISGLHVFGLTASLCFSRLLVSAQFCGTFVTFHHAVGLVAPPQYAPLSSVGAPFPVWRSGEFA